MARPLPLIPEIRALTVLKCDSFGAVLHGLQADGPIERPVAVRDASAGPVWLRPVAKILLGREAKALHRLAGVDSVPELLTRARGLLVRSWVDGRPLSEGTPPLIYWSSGRKLLRQIRAAGVTHNDTHKPENWIVRPDGTAGLIDFQLAGCHPRPTAWSRLCGLEDLRHLVKQKRRFARESLTASEKSLLTRRSWPARFWRRWIKPGYRFVTRGLLNWRDREGRGPSQPPR